MVCVVGRCRGKDGKNDLKRLKWIKLGGGLIGVDGWRESQEGVESQQGWNLLTLTTHFPHPSCEGKVT